MLTRENGKFIYAKKLFEIAKYFGFDGWFINEETGGGSIDQWTEFIRQFNEYADAEGYKDMEIQWYQAHSGPNTRILKSHKNTSHFLDYGRVNDYRHMASTLIVPKKKHANLWWNRSSATRYDRLWKSIEKCF